MTWSMTWRPKEKKEEKKKEKSTKLMLNLPRVMLSSICILVVAVNGNIFIIKFQNRIFQ